MLILLLSACSADLALGQENGSPADTASGTTTDSGATTTATDSDETGTEDLVEPGWFAVDATVTIAEGAPVAAPAAVTLTVVGTDTQTQLCELTLPSDALSPGTPPDASLWAWWTLPVLASDACAVLPDTVGLGLGPMVADLRAALGSSGLDGVADSLYGAYVSPNGAGPWAFGVGGTTTDFEGDDAAAAPLPDGSYQITTLYLVALPSQAR